MKAYHGIQELKMTMVAAAIRHREADRLAQGFGYGKLDADGKWRGCAMGCTIQTINLKQGRQIRFGDHAAYESELGVPRMLAYLEDGIFEALPKAAALTWPERFLQAIPIGADLSLVGDQFLHWLLVDPVAGVIQFARTEQARKVVQDVADHYAKKIGGATVTREQWDAVRAAAWRARHAAAVHAADAATGDTAAAAEACAGRKKARVRQSVKLLELMAAAPVMVGATENWFKSRKRKIGQRGTGTDGSGPNPDRINKTDKI